MERMKQNITQRWIVDRHAANPFIAYLPDGIHTAVGYKTVEQVKNEHADRLLEVVEREEAELIAADLQHAGQVHRVDASYYIISQSYATRQGSYWTLCPMPYHFGTEQLTIEIDRETHFTVKVPAGISEVEIARMTQNLMKQ